MPLYQYYCDTCHKEVEIFHSMSEIDNPSEETQIATSCNATTCKGHEDAVLGRPMRRIFGTPAVLKFGHGSGNKGGLLSKEEKSKAYRKRSADDNEKQGFNERRVEDTKKIVEKFKP